METFYRSIPEFIVKTDDITKLSNRACDNLKLGDEVILFDGDEQIKYNVISKSTNGMKLANITGEAVVEVIYSKEGNDWSYVETKTTALGGGGTKLYRHTIIVKDNENNEYYFWAITNDGNQLRFNSNFTLTIGENCIAISREQYDELWFAVCHIMYTSNDHEFRCLTTTPTSIVKTLTSLTDTVTEL